MRAQAAPCWKHAREAGISALEQEHLQVQAQKLAKLWATGQAGRWQKAGLDGQRAQLWACPVCPSRLPQDQEAGAWASGEAVGAGPGGDPGQIKAGWKEGGPDAQGSLPPSTCSAPVPDCSPGDGTSTGKSHANGSCGSKGLQCRTRGPSIGGSPSTFPQRPWGPHDLRPGRQGPHITGS